MTEEQVQLFSKAFDGMKSKWEELNGKIDKQRSDADQFAATVREQLGAMVPTGGYRSIGIEGALLASKELYGRPPVAERGMVIRIPIASKDILNVSRALPEVITDIAAGGRIATNVRSLIPSSSTTAGAVTYLKETAFTNNAAPVAEGALKPQSEKTFTTVTLPVEVIAHYFKCSKQTYEDTNGLAAFLSANLIYGLDVRVEAQILKGDGTPPNLQGLYPLAVAAAAAPAGSTLVDKLVLASAELSAAGFSATGAVVSPVDWTAQVLLKDTQERYIGTGSNLPPLPTIVSSSALASGEWLIGDFRQSHLFVREDSNVTIATTNEDDFCRNMVTALGEIRLALAVYNVAGFRKAPAA